MCSCEPSFVCARCKGTPFDPHYEADERLTEDDFDALAESRRAGEPLMFGGEA